MAAATILRCARRLSSAEGARLEDKKALGTQLVATMAIRYGWDMSAILEKLAKEALQLQPAERAELADFLVESLETAEPDETRRLWMQEAQKRLDEVRRGAVRAIPGQQVLAEARSSIKR